ncbi:MAG: DUF131 domain-containing protein [Thermoplasmata archaeon]|nr:DUF131 domain-containing protein [Thermoplasmata archaeon]
MVRWGRAASPLLLVIGAGLVVHAVLTGNAHLFLLVIVPVVAGSSVEFFLGVVLLAIGLFVLPWSLVGTMNEVDSRGAERERPDPGSSHASGGVVLVGPIPIFFGSWRAPSRARYLAAVAVGLVLLVIVVALFLVF